MEDARILDTQVPGRAPGEIITDETLSQKV